MIIFPCGLPENFSILILVVQHILPDFTGIFSKKLDKNGKTRSKGRETREYNKILVLIHSPNGKHLVFRHVKIYLDDESIVNFIKSSVDVTMKSAAMLFRKNAVGTILTGSWAYGAVVELVKGV